MARRNLPRRSKKSNTSNLKMSTVTKKKIATMTRLKLERHKLLEGQSQMRTR